MVGMWFIQYVGTNKLVGTWSTNKLVLMRAEIQCSERDLKSQNTYEGHLIHFYNGLIPQERFFQI